MSGDVEEIIKAGKLSDSLFSLEVIVEKITAPSIVCRFPAVAFRLLDFPTLILYHVEPDLAETIKTKVRADPMYKIPAQFSELKDRKGHFIMKKGKSCLFKIPPETLHAHLMNTPLYVMLIDTFPEVPKLLGNCSIPLDDVMDLIYKDISHMGVSVPTAHGQKGDYKIFNLMGSEIGEITLGLRLLSLGMGMMQHIPDSKVVTYNPKQKTKVEENSNESERIKAVDKTTQMILQSIEASDKDIQVSVSDFIPKKEDTDTQTDTELSKKIRAHSSVQTEKQKKRVRERQHKQKTYAEISDEINDFFITNMSCPPPLFYNSEAHEPQKILTTHEGLTFNDNYCPSQEIEAPSYAWAEESQSDSSSQESTIRHEDKFSDSDIELDYNFREVRVVQRKSKKAMKKEALSKARGRTDKSLALQTSHAFQNMQKQTLPNLQQLPLLNALMTEILALQGLSIDQLQPTHKTTQAIVTKSSKVSTSRSTARSREIKEDREARWKQLATPRSATKRGSDLPSHRVCSGSGKPVPKDKSWVQNNPKFSKPVKSTDLKFGLTKAQRLRLEKNNPELLKKIEAEHEERVKESQAKTKAKYEKFSKDVETGARLMSSTRVSARTKAQDEAKCQESMQSLDRSDMISRVHRRPIPTPRKSISSQNGHHVRDTLEALAQKELGPPPNGTGYLGSDENLHIDLGQSQESLDAPIPDTSRITNDNSVFDSFSHAPQNKPTIKAGFGKTQTINNPGFPTETPPTSMRDRIGRPDSHMTDYGNYSEDFDNISTGSKRNGLDLSGEEPPLRKIVDQYSDDQASNVSNMSGDEPSLRKIVDKYSDDDQGSVISRFSGDEPSLRKIVDKYSDDDQNSERSQGSGEEPSLRKIVDKYSADDNSDKGSDEYSTAFSHSEYSDRPKSVNDDRNLPKTLKMPPSMPSPMASVHSPINAMRPIVPPTGEGMAASSTPTETECASNESTAYIRASQIPTMSDNGASQDIEEELRKSSPVFKPKPSPRRKIERLSSIHTESVSSYAPSEDRDNDFSEDDKSESFNYDSDVSDKAPGSIVKQMNELKLAPEARMGYTWGYSKK